MANSPDLTIIGNIVSEPELNVTPSGTSVCNIRVAQTPRTFNKQTNQHEDGEAIFITVTVWGAHGENVAQSLTKGMRVIVNGDLKQRSYQTKEGENRTVFEIDNAEVGPSLRFATAQVVRSQGGQQAPQGGHGAPQQHQGGFGGQQAPQAQQGGYQQQGQQLQQDAWGSAPTQGNFGGQQPGF